MPMSIQALRELKAEKIEAARALHAKDNFGDAEQKEFDALMAEAQAIDTRIKNDERLNGLTDPAQAAAVAGAANAAHIEVEHKAVYRNLGEQMLDVRAMTIDSADAPKARERFQKVVNAASGASTGIDGEGGYLVETDKASSILTTAIETGVLSSRCTSQPIGANADSFSYMAADDRDRSTGKRNGIQVYRKGEADTLVSSGKALLKERELRVEDMYGLIYVTNRMLRDAVAMAEYAKRCLREQLAWKLDYEIFQGSGAGQCLGIMNSDLPVTVSKETSQTADTINATNVIKMLARFTGDITKAAWFINQDCLPQLPLMTVGNQPVFVPGGSFANAPFGVLLGLPIVPIEFCKTLGDKGDIILGDFSQYLLVRKGGVEEAESMHVKFLTDEMAYRFITRNNGQPMHDAPITPLNGSATLSPFVMLEAR
ncbi:phage major capsid protein [Nitratidesulfovibrio sp. 1201_IL3209]|uniref:phage major capsid protein n=1 Tax=Nitratidesulfovibrio sp. 1201_IL3209 TaxID=3084053 RepID=UPI002FDAB344